MAKAFDFLSSAGHVLAECLSQHEVDPRIHGRRLASTVDNAAAHLRKLCARGWLAPVSGAGDRAAQYTLTEEGLAQAHLARAAIKADLAERAEAWKRDNHVFGVARPAGSPPLNEIQIQAWVTGYWLDQIRRGEVPVDAPPEVRAGFEEAGRRIIRRLEPKDPFKGRL